MRRTTICRSEHRAALLALVAGLLAGRAPVLAAQDTTHARPDTSQRAPDTSQAAPAQATPAPGLQGQVPATHVVAAGETLWSISQLYFNDPLLWPEIYRLNTTIIDDPHWIYPGEELNLAAAGGVAQAPETTAVAVAPQNTGDTVRAQPAPLPPADTVKAAPPVAVTAPPETTTVVLDTTQAVEAVPPPPPEPSVTYLTVFERRRTAGQQVRDVLKAYANRPYRPLRRGEFYAAGFLTEEESLPYGRVISNTALPVIPRFTDRTSALPFDQLAVEPAHNASYHVGDSLLVVRIDRDITNWGKVVVPTGVARVTEVQRRQVLADVIMQFYPIHDGQLVLPLEPFKDPGEVRPTPVEEGLEGTVIAARDLHVLPGPQQIVFINRGRAEGVSPGDVFDVFKPATGVPGTSSEQVQMTLQIVHTRDHSASGLVLNIDRPHLVPGMPVRLIRKMPS
jgi:LysM repeat protein